MPRRLPDPFTVPHFKRWVRDRDLTLEDGGPVKVEAWMEPIVGDIFARIRRGKQVRPRFKEVWLVIPQGNAKTTLMAIVALYCADFSREPWIPIGASSRDQAEVLFGQAAAFVDRSVPMKERFKTQPGHRRILSLVNGGRGIKVYPADSKTGDGVIPYPLCLCDEGHRWKDLRLYGVWKGKLRKRGAQIVMMSTAGEPGGPFERVREALRNAASKRKRLGRCYLRAESATAVIHEYAVPNVKLARDIDVVKEANPLSTITKRDLAEDLASPTLDYGEDWLRLTCSIPARSSKAAVAESDWDDAGSLRPDDPPEAWGEDGLQIPDGVPVAVGADHSWVLDPTALVPLWMPSPEFRLLGEATVLDPPGDGTMLDVEDVKQAYRDIHERNPIHTVVMDTTKAQDVAQWLAGELGCEVVDRGQTNSLAAEDYEAFTEGLRIRALRHTGGVNLRQHVMNAIARALPGGKKRFDRPSPSRAAAYRDQRVVDALISAAMVHTAAVHGLKVVKRVPLVAVGRR
jgi:phage terminase large subunit-like protein